MRKRTHTYKVGIPIVTIIFGSVLMTISSFYNDTWFFNWKDTRKEIIDTVQVAKYDMHQNGFGESGYSIGSKRLKWLSKNATIAELQIMSEYPNNSIKLAAYLGLIKKVNKPEKYRIILEAVQDTSKIDIVYGCIISKVAINEHLMSMVIPIDTTLPPLPISPYGIPYDEYLLNQYGFVKEDKKEILKAYYSSIK